MRQLRNLASNYLAHFDADGTKRPAVEVVVTTSEPRYRPGDDKKLMADECDRLNGVGADSDAPAHHHG